MNPPLLELREVCREYRVGDGTFVALRDINLYIEAGECIAITGPSGSGKSTLLNIIGCLDRPTSGSLYVAGQDTANLDGDALAALRRDWFGFVFQKYNLLPELAALANVELPAIYSGQKPSHRHTRASELLTHLKIADRLHHRSSQLSGGQQQRVSIARALMNGGEIILADEPTGALDSQAGEAVLDTLKDLHADGCTVILVTHDRTVARRAERVIEVRDGGILSDRSVPDRRRPKPKERGACTIIRARATIEAHRRDNTQCFLEAFNLALLALRTHRLRMFLTMLGIVIGIASVTSVIALGSGSRARVLADIRGMGTNTLDIYPGGYLGDEKANRVRTLTSSDAELISRQDYVDGVTPTVSVVSPVRFGGTSLTSSINGVGEQYFRVHDLHISRGRLFSAAETHSLAQVALIDDQTSSKLFGHGQNPLNQVIFVGDMPVRVIGVTKPTGGIVGFNQNPDVWIPYTAVISRMIGTSSSLRSITARIRDDAPFERAASAVTELLLARHGRKDFFVIDTNTIRKTVESTTETLTLLIASIAVISLVVGGIGVMNIMLVSVTERTREIGIRLAVGARRIDILQQFLIEAALVCLLGGVIGAALALVLGFTYSHIGSGFPMIFSTYSIVGALVVSCCIGITFGYLPARRAARLDPIEALSRE